MMRLAAIGTALALIGCFNPHPTQNAPCAPNGDCPSGLACESGFCVTPGTGPGGDDAAIDTSIPDDAAIDGAVDAAIDAVGVVDTDGDGKPDGQDNCPTIANANQHNEDGDAKGDVCDNCPHINAAFTDTDGDGVGDACDPHPNIGGDAIARFIPFDTLPADLVLTGTWTLTGDTLKQGGQNNPRVRIPTNYAKVTAEVGGSVDAVSATSRELKIVTAWTAANQWHSCGFDDTDGTSKFTFEIENENAGSTIILNSPEPLRPDKISLGAFYIRNTADATAHTVTCAGNEGAFPITTNASAPALTAGMVEVQASRTDFTIKYIILITSP